MRPYHVSSHPSRSRSRKPTVISEHPYDMSSQLRRKPDDLGFRPDYTLFCDEPVYASQATARLTYRLISRPLLALLG